MVFFSIVSTFLAFAEKGDNSIVAKRDVSVNQPQGNRIWDKIGE